MAAVPPPPEGGEINPPEPLQYTADTISSIFTTWVLKVSIHCEGCKRKVKRILHRVEGVYTIDVDTKQHKVVVTGNVDANTLLRKLEKSGKHAQLWHNCYPNHEQQQDVQQQPSPPTNVEDSNHTQNPPVEQQPPENHQQRNQQVVKEVRFEGNPQPSGHNSQPPAAGSGGGGKKKKKKKSSNPNNNSNGNNNGEQQQLQQQQQHQGVNSGQPQNESQQPGSGMGSGPIQGQGLYPNPIPEESAQGQGQPGDMQYGNSRVYEYPPTYHVPPPVYAVSYNTVYPRSYAASYYSAPAYLYAQAHQGGDVGLVQPSNWLAPSLQLQPSNTFELFSDENPNACSVM